MNDDFNTPILLSHLFELVRIINSAKDKKEKLSAEDISELKNLYQHFIFDVMGLRAEKESGKTFEVLDNVMKMVLDLRQTAKNNKDFATSDMIRNYLTQHGIQIKDGKEGAAWTLSN
jgi:cysteinyl-tRNA synthetase